jgi:hypothetical protein
MLAPGKYRGRPVTAALGLTSKNTEQIAVTFELVDPPGERITWYGFFTENTTDRTLQSLRSCGWQGNDLSVFVGGEPLPAGFDQEVELEVEQSEYQGKTTAKVAWVNSGGGLGLKNALTKDQAKVFAAKMQRTIDALDKAAGRAAAAAPKTNGKPAQPEPPIEHLEGQDPAQQVEDVPY